MKVTVIIEDDGKAGFTSLDLSALGAAGNLSAMQVHSALEELTQGSLDATIEYAARHGKITDADLTAITLNDITPLLTAIANHNPEPKQPGA